MIKHTLFSLLLVSPLCFSMMDAADIDATNTDSRMVSGLDLRQTQAAFNDSKADGNVVSYVYGQNLTYKISLRETMTTTVVLPPGEETTGHILGDTTQFTYRSYLTERGSQSGLTLPPNIIILEPVNPGVDTNLTVFGKSGNIYSFYLRTDSIKSSNLPHLVAYILDKDLTARVNLAAGINGTKEPESEEDASTPVTPELVPDEDADYLRELPPVDPVLINRNYKVIGGDKSLEPLEVFDDGIGFTYFKYGKNFDKTAVPALYQVVDGYDVPVNTQIRDGHIVAKLLYPSWTLRLGKKHLCIRKEEK